MPETPAPPTPATAAAADSRPAPRGAMRRVRIDEGSAGGSHDLPPGRGSLLRAFCGWRGRTGSGSTPRPAPAQERRAEPRHDRVECQAWVGWKARRRFEMNDALVINLSRSGAQIFLDTLPPTDVDLWIYLETPDQNAVVKAHVLEVVATSKGQCVVRVAFREPCPFAFFEAAVCGLAPVNPRTRVAKPAHPSARGPRSSAIPSR